MKGVRGDRFTLYSVKKFMEDLHRWFKRHSLFYTDLVEGVYDDSRALGRRVGIVSPNFI